MNIWLPLIASGGGADVLTDSISDGLNELGWNASRRELPHPYQFAPWLGRHVAPPPSTDLIATHSWHGPAFHRRDIPMVAIEHLFTPDSQLRPYRTTLQNVFHEVLVRRFVDYSYRNAAVTVSVSDFTRRQVLAFSPHTQVKTIRNGTDLDFFSPAGKKPPRKTGQPLKLLFVGNLIARKGVDMIPDIMQSLGSDYQLSYTQGLRTHSVLDDIPNARCIGKLDRQQMRSAYREADLLLFPSRMEGLPLAIIEAAACGLPAVASDASSMPEAVVDGETGRLCAQDQTRRFVEAIKGLAENPGLIEKMGENARTLAEEKFDARRMVNSYRVLFEQILDEKA